MDAPRGTYRIVAWPNDRPGIRTLEAAGRLGIRTREVLDLIDRGVLVMWRNPTAWGTWVDADEVEALRLRRETDDGPHRATG